MKVKIESHGEAEHDALGEEPYIRRALALADPEDVKDELALATDASRSNLSYCDHVVITEDDGTVLWQGDL